MEHSKDTERHDIRMDLLSEIGRKVGSVSELSQLVEQITQMTQHTLQASASSVLLLDEEKQEFFFEVAEGEAGEALKQIRLSTQSGIAGWVARHGKPLIINDVTKDERFDKRVDKATGFVTRSMMCIPLVIQRRTIGVVQVLNKVDGSDFSEQDLETLVSVGSTAAMAIENTRLHQKVVDGYKSTIKALAASIDAKDPYTRGHSERVTEYALWGGISLPLSQEELEVLEYAGILHDIGKIGIPDSVLRKPGRLTPEEWDVVRQHPVIGANIIKDIPFLEEARKLVLCHHERYDGAGYPDGLMGNDIPIGARLLAVADSFDSMTSDRAYRAARSADIALEELHKCSGTQFCPIAAQAFISGFDAGTKRPSSGLL